MATDAIGPDILSFFIEDEDTADFEIGEDFKTQLLSLTSDRQDSLAVVQKQFFEGLLTGKHTTCPCCTSRGKLYGRKLNAGMASVLLWVYRASPILADDQGWLHVTKELLELKTNAVAKEYSKLRFWNLLEEMPKSERDLTKRGTGYWRLTERGRDFCVDGIAVPKRVYIFDNRLFGHSKETTTLRTALGDRFDWGELMSADLVRMAALLGG